MNRNSSNVLSDLLCRYLVDGDEDAIDEVVRQTRPRLLAAARRIGSPQDAEDTVQSAYLSLMRLRGHGLSAPVMPWLLTAVVRIAYRRKAIDRREARIAELLARRRESRAPESDVVSAEETARLEGAVASLPALYRDPIVLHDLQGLSTPDTARLLGISEATVRTRLHRARRLLRASLFGRVALIVALVPWLLIDRARAASAILVIGGVMKTQSVVVGLVVVVALAIGAVFWSSKEGRTAAEPRVIEPASHVAEAGAPATSPSIAPSPATMPPAALPIPPKSEPPAAASENTVGTARPLFDPERLDGETFVSDIASQLALLEWIVERYPIAWHAEETRFLRVTSEGKTGEPEVHTTWKGKVTAAIGPDAEEIEIHFEAHDLDGSGPTSFRLAIGDRRSDARMRAIRSPGMVSSVLQSWRDAVGVTYDFRVAEGAGGSRVLETVRAQTTAWLDRELIPHVTFARDAFRERRYVLGRPGADRLAVDGEATPDVDAATWSRVVRIFEQFTAGIPR